VAIQLIVRHQANLNGPRSCLAKDADLDGSGRPVAQLAILLGLFHYSISASPVLVAAVSRFLELPMVNPK
jgi:hypothetical protein